MATTKKQPFEFHGYRITHSEIIVSEDKIYTEEIANVEIQAKGKVDGNSYILYIDFEVKSDSGDVYIKIKVRGHFRYVEKLDELSEIPDFFTLNAPAIIFPYIRAHISALSALSGIPAINIPVFNLVDLQPELQKNIEVVKPPKQ